MAKKIEVEIRSLLSDEEFNRLLALLTQNAELLDDEMQETHYLSGEHDLRIQKNSTGSKIWLKKGKMHDEAREEIEIIASEDAFGTISDLFSSLGHTLNIKWLRARKRFSYKECIVTLDDTKGYGKIVELEKLVPSQDSDSTLMELKSIAQVLGIACTSKEVFEKKFNEYQRAWKTLLGN